MASIEWPPGAGMRVEMGQGMKWDMVYSSLAILIVNFFLTLLLSLVFPAGAGSG